VRATTAKLYPGRDTFEFGQGHVTKNQPITELILLRAGTWFLFAKMDIEIPRRLWMKFEEMPPFLYSKQILAEVVLPHMLEYLRKTGRRGGDRKKSWWGRSSRKSCYYTPHCCGGMSNTAQ